MSASARDRGRGSGRRLDVWRGDRPRSRPRFENNGHDGHRMRRGSRRVDADEAPGHRGDIRDRGSTALPRLSSSRWSNTYLDVPTVLRLAEWVHDSVKSMGRRSTREVVEIHDIGGHLSAEVKEVLLRFVSFSNVQEPKGTVEMESLVITILKLDRILGGKADAAAVLSLLIAKEG